MTLNICDPEAEELAAELARITGETKTAAVAIALRDRLVRVRQERDTMRPAERLLANGPECAGLQVLDERSDEEILGYDKDGLPR